MINENENERSVLEYRIFKTKEMIQCKNDIISYLDQKSGHFEGSKDFDVDTLHELEERLKKVT